MKLTSPPPPLLPLFFLSSSRNTSFSLVGNSPAIRGHTIASYLNSCFFTLAKEHLLHQGYDICIVKPTHPQSHTHINRPPLIFSASTVTYTQPSHSLTPPPQTLNHSFPTVSHLPSANSPLQKLTPQARDAPLLSHAVAMLRIQIRCNLFQEAPKILLPRKEHLLCSITPELLSIHQEQSSAKRIWGLRDALYCG